MPVVVRIVENRFPEIARQLRREASAAVRAECFEIEADIKAQMSGTKSGRIYGAHQASAPGEAPAVDEGALIGSVMTEASPGSTSGYVYTDKDYALHLEFGTVHIAPRPAWIPAAERAAPRFRQRVEQLLRRLR